MKRAVILSVIDQALISIFNLALNLAFIALATPTEFGRFILIQAIAFFFMSAQNALVIMPLNYLLPGREPDEVRVQLSMLTSANAVLMALALPFAWGVSFFVEADAALAVSIIAFFVTVMMREYSRNLLIVRGDVQKALVTDAMMIVCAAIVAIALWTWTSPEAAVLLALAAGNVVAIVASRQDFAFQPRAIGRHLTAYREVWKETRWALQGALQNEVQARSYVLFIERWRDAAALGTLQAGRVTIAPLMLIVTAWRRVARPRMVEDIQAGRHAQIYRMLLAGFAMTALGTIIYGAALAVMWPLMESYVFQSRYENMEMIVACWWLYAMIVGLAGVAGTLLEANRSFRALAAVGFAVAVAIIVALAGLWFTEADMIAIVLAMTAIHTVELAVYCALIYRKPKVKAFHGEAAR